MFIRHPPRSKARKELKVQVPSKTHDSLRALQERTGLEAPALVAEALNLYFSRLVTEAPRRGPR